MFAQWVVYAGITSNATPSYAFQLLLMLLPNFAFCCGISLLAQFEQSGEGAQWGNLDVDIDNTAMSQILWMMVFDIGFYTVLGWYLEQIMYDRAFSLTFHCLSFTAFPWLFTVLSLSFHCPFRPKEFGVVQPPWFFAQKSYWTGKASDSHASPAPKQQLAPGFTTEKVEQVSSVLKSQEAAGTCVQLVGLRKCFSGPAGVKTAVNDLTLSMYEGQIFALLGHNGAGKTTTIGMLTGMLAPTR